MRTVFIPARAPRSVRRGVSIIELMVGLVVGLLVSLAAVSSAQLFTAAQRQGIGTGSGNGNAASAMASIKNDLANGGLGFFGDLTYLCSRLNLSINGTTVIDGAAFSPVTASRPGASTNDMLDVAYASNVIGGVAVTLNSASDGMSAALKTLLPVSVNQSVLLASTDTAVPCTLRSVTAITAPTATTSQVLTFGNAGLNNQVNFSTLPSYPAGSWVTLVGALRWNRYSVNGTNLQMTDMTTGVSSTLLRNVIGFRVLYGISAAPAMPVPVTSTGNTGTVIDWKKTTDAGWGSVTSANIGQVKAVRIALVLRSAQREKTDASGNCNATQNKPTLWADLAALGVASETIEPDVADWQCYRYRTQIIVAPMRNIVYGQ